MTLSREAAMIKTVIRLQNDMVLVFDENGEQVPQYQGRYEDVRGNVLRDAPTGTAFNHWFCHPVKAETMAKERW